MGMEGSVEDRVLKRASNKPDNKPCGSGGRPLPLLPASVVHVHPGFPQSPIETESQTMGHQVTVWTDILSHPRGHLIHRLTQ